MKRYASLVLALGLISGIALSVFEPQIFASRNGGGTYNLPSGNPVVTGTTITSSWANTTLNDMATAMTNSLDRTGTTGGMTGALKLYVGTVTSPGAQFSSESNSGLYRNASHDIRMSVNGVDQQKWSTTGSTVPLAFTQGTGGTDPDTSGYAYPLSVLQRIQPISPAPTDPTNFPLGSDLWLMSRGSADIRLRTWSINLTSTTSVSATSNVLITTGSSSTVCPSTSTSDGDCATLSGSTAFLCTPASHCALVINQDATDTETIDWHDWSITSATQLTVTFAKAHTQPFNVRQIGSTFLDSRGLQVNVGDVADRPVSLFDKGGNPELTLTNDTSGTWPLSGIQVLAPVTGASGVTFSDGGNPGYFVYRNRIETSCFQMINYDATSTLASFCEVANASPAQNDAIVYFGGGYADAGTFNTVTIAAAGDIGRIYGGGYNSGLIVYTTTSQTGDGGNGSFIVRNNGVDDTDYFKVNTATGKTQMLMPSTLNSGGFLNSGQLTIGSATSTTATANVSTGCLPQCTNTSAARAPWCNVNTNTLTATGTNGDVYNYVCFF